MLPHHQPLARRPGPGRPPVTDCCYPECSAPITTKVIDVPLCDRHCAHVYRQVAGAARGLQHTPMTFNGTGAARAPGAAGPRGLIYFLQFADRIKIGFTTDLAKRRKSIPHDDLLATIPGTMSDEKRLHREFADDRIKGEWFRSSERLLAYIAALEGASG
jgi:hypothetical protein